ncbi:class II fructose-bisphosphate aldolase, partial [Bacillaceae bacterium Marseille-Q3522]|nr:class II fructose-bisphosphate aldolase [Bacillaceae bacterium Marseille-Q3522]
MYVPMKVLLQDANINNYAVIAANCINIELARATITAAAEMNSPIIVSVSQGQMAYHADGELMSILVHKFAQRVNIPVALNLDHGRTFEGITYAFRHGFGSVMIDASETSLEENINITKEVIKLAHSQDVSVEAELGHVGQASKGDQGNNDLYTDPLDAKRFVEETNVDALAVAVGTAHGSYPKGIEPKIDFERLKAIKDILKIPLVLHGGSNSGDENIRKAVKYG